MLSQFERGLGSDPARCPKRYPRGLFYPRVVGWNLEVPLVFGARASEISGISLDHLLPRWIHEDSHLHTDCYRGRGILLDLAVWPRDSDSGMYKELENQISLNSNPILPPVP